MGEWFDIEEEPLMPDGRTIGQLLTTRSDFNGYESDAPYRKLGNRVSLLPIAQYCGKAAELSERYGAGRPAAMSTAFHARQAGSPDAAALWARLSEAEQQEVLGWKSPKTVVMSGGVSLDYAHAMKEIEVALDCDGYWAEVDGPDVMTIGHADLAWAPYEIEGLRVAFVGDIKKSAYTTEDGPESLQLHGYGWAVARKFHCDAYCCGLWLAEEGEWLWSQQWVVLDSDRGREIWDRIRYAATHKTGEATTGQHCRHCWSRLHCPEQLLPAKLGAIEKMLAPLTEGGDITMVDHNTILRLQALSELCDKAKKVAQAAIERGVLKVRDPDSGKIWAPVEMPGRQSVDVDKLRSELGDGANRFIRRGNSYTQFRWMKPK